ncbi:glycosyltransferase [Phycicoccus endophyticus]|uniref:Glycosyltransferase n=1 Tax=Phycicoccus endophyticus TaxID=1690220 RepID=A0A7G9R342_9MICO|nr:glycosyltransferase [Phycicoccus endophyticus]
MTLAPPRPADAAPVPAGGVAAPTVTAFVVTHRDPSGLAALLAAVRAQTQRPDAVVVLDRTGGSAVPAADGEDTVTVADVLEDVRAHDLPVTALAVPPRVPVRRALHRAVAELEPVGGGPALAWFLPVGTQPEPDALVRLVDAWRRSPSTGIVGPKHVDLDNPTRLRALSIRTTRGGRLLARPGAGEPDQGQYDAVTDVLAVPLAGSLLERDLLLRLRGWESSFGDVGADLDLGWRAQLSGRRVVVVPRSRVRSGPGAAVTSATTSARRRAARRVALARAPWWSGPFLALWIAVTSVVAAVGLLLLKRPRSAWAELTALTSLDPVRGWRARWRTRHRAAVRRRDLGSVFEPRRAVLTSWGDAVHHALVPPQAPIGDATADLNPRSWVVKVVRHPGVLAVVSALGVAAVAGRDLGLGVLTGLGSGLTGGELVGARTDAAGLWHGWRDGWTGPGLGGPEQSGPWSALLAAPTWVLEHLPLVPSAGSPAGLVVGLLVVLAMPLGALSAYLALRVVSRRRWLRALAAFGWAVSGPAAAAVAQGRLGAVLALVLLPAVAAGLWLLATGRSTATSVFASALALVVLGRSPRCSAPSAWCSPSASRSCGAVGACTPSCSPASPWRSCCPGCCGREPPPGPRSSRGSAWPTGAAAPRSPGGSPSWTPAAPGPRSCGPRHRSRPRGSSRWPVAGPGAAPPPPSGPSSRSCWRSPWRRRGCGSARCRPASRTPANRSPRGWARSCCRSSSSSSSPSSTGSTPCVPARSPGGPGSAPGASWSPGSPPCSRAPPGWRPRASAACSSPGTTRAPRWPWTRPREPSPPAACSSSPASAVPGTGSSGARTPCSCAPCPRRARPTPRWPRTSPACSRRCRAARTSWRRRPPTCSPSAASRYPRSSAGSTPRTGCSGSARGAAGRPGG